VRNNLGLLALARGEHAQARALFEQSLAITDRLGAQASSAIYRSSLGAAAEAAGDIAGARDAYLVSRQLSETVGDLIGTAYADINLANLALLHEKNPAEARRLYQSALDALGPLDDRAGIAECLIGLGRAAAAAGECKRAVRLCNEGLTLHRETCDKKGIASAFEALAEAALGQNEPAYCRTFLAVAVSLRDEIGARRTPSEAERLARIERAAIAMGDDNPVPPAAAGLSAGPGAACAPDLQAAVAQALALAVAPDDECKDQ
jgi:tetratricopeptide (TPR) repeat protein